MRTTTRPARVLLAAVVLSISGCAPLSVWTGDGYTFDDSRSVRGSSVVGHCFRLRLDGEIRSFDTHIDLRGGGAVDVAGRIDVLAPGSAPRVRVDLPKGSRIVVERVLATRTLEMSWRKPYVRINGGLLDASAWFRDTADGEGPFRLTYVDRLLEPCDDTR